LKRLSRFPKEKFLVRSGEPSIEPPKAPIMPQKRHTNLAEFLKVNGNVCGLAYRNRAWFENANYLFHPDYGEEGPNLTFAQSKDMFYVHPQGSVDYFFDLEDARFDSRFIFPDLSHGSLHFGNYHDNQLGRIFFLTEPKDASDVLLSVNEPSGICEWLKDDPNVKFFRHEDKHFQLYAILPIGSRLDLDHEFVITHPTAPNDDQKFFTRLFQEKLRRLVDFTAPETRYVRPLTEAEQESQARRANYTELLNTLSEKFQTICEIRNIGAASPFNDPVSVYYKGHRYFYNDGDMSTLKVVVNTDFEFYQKLEKRIDFVRSLIKNGLAASCTEFEADIDLKFDRQIRLAGFSDDVITLCIFHHHDKFLGPCNVVHERSISIDEFNTPSEGSVAESFIRDAEEFFGRHREKYHAFKKLYEVNLSYHNLVNLSSRPPELDYTYIFRDL